ncbi:hypothetical protein RSPO_m00060 (plasmid) [Ralstonia solanacearum Po82]|uniref:Uncharacterized protein n=1 Tax=Ralstonia solanacearum (strain Po82) TaxID=1031711 RepID=F6G825_RALS8|nr:hypothetical protein RSPO_m00060 [Ralstonia solanacearum Po82]
MTPNTCLIAPDGRLGFKPERRDDVVSCSFVDKRARADTGTVERQMRTHSLNFVVLALRYENTYFSLTAVSSGGLRSCAS